MSRKEQRLRSNFDPDTVKPYFKNILPPANLDTLLAEKKMFTDSTFPPTDQSIDSLTPTGEFVDKEEGPANKEEMLECNRYKASKRAWKRPEEVIPGKWEIFLNGIELKDIVQGNLGNCYFISAVAALVEFPDLLKQNFPTQKYADIGYYEVVLYIDGEWQRVFIDNYFPINKNYKKPEKAFYFTQPNGKELWAMLLEKAWAKVNGGYSNTSGGNQCEVLLAFTGYPSEILFNKTQSPLKIFEKIENADKHDAVMGCASYPGCDQDDNPLGISYGHAYTLIDAKSKGEDVSKIYLYKIRNPWGEGEWTGDWNDKDPKWDSEPDLKKFYKFQDKEDGIFFMSVDDFPSNFQNTQICRILYDAKMKNYLINKEEFFKGSMIYNVKLPKKGEVIFSVVERSRRFDRSLPYEQYAFFSLLIFKYDENYNITKFIGGKSSSVALGIHEELDAGYYACVIYFPFEYENLGPNFSYTFTIYSQVEFTSKFTGKDPKLQCLENLIISYFRKTKDYEVGTAGKYICTDIKEIQNATNLTPRIFYNNLNQKIMFKIDYKNKKGVETVGHFDSKYQKTEGPYELVLDKGKFGLYILAAVNQSKSYKPSCSLAYGKDVEVKDATDFENYRFDNLLLFDFADDKDLVSPDKKPEKEINVMTKDTASKIPVLKGDKNKESQQKKEEVAPQTSEKFTNPLNSICSYENLAKEYPDEFDTLSKNIKERQNQQPFPWIKIQNPNGIYAGQMNPNTKIIEGRGIFLFNNGQIYIGRFSNGNMNEFGYIFNANKNLVYKGELMNGTPNGNGILYKENNNYYIGKFTNGILNGYGIAVDSKGNEWLGNYTNNMENGVGLLKTADPKNFYLYEFVNGDAKGRFLLNDEEATVFKMKRDKCSNLEEQYSLGQCDLKTVEDTKNKYLVALQKVFEYKQKKGPDAVHKNCKLEDRKDIDKNKEKNYEMRRQNVDGEDNVRDMDADEIKENEKEKKKKEAQEKEEEEFYDCNCNPVLNFLTWQIQTMNPFLSKSDIIIDKEKTSPNTNSYYLYSTKTTPNGNTYKAISNNNSYYIGEFKDDIPNGTIRKFNKNKRIEIIGNMHKPFKFDDGPAEKFFNNGDHYYGPLVNELAEGEGEVLCLNGDRIIADFKKDKKQGKGKLLERVGFNQYDVTFKDDAIVGKQKTSSSDKFYKTIKGTLTFLDDKERETLFSYFNEVPPVLTKNKLRWAIMKGKDNNNYYIGQVNPSNKKEGRGIICNTGYDLKHFYIGQFKDNKKEGYGLVLNPQYQIEYEGDYKNDSPNGYGNFFLNAYSYHGSFLNGKPNGFGTRYPHEASPYVNVQGIYKEGKEFKVSKIDYQNQKTQILEYDDDGNLVKFETATDNFGPDFNRKIIKNNAKIKKNYDINEIYTLPPVAPKLNFMTTLRYEVDGLYIGEVDELGMKVGRGKMINQFDGSYYFGYWFNNIREGNGRLFDKDGNIKYDGTFMFDKAMEEGTYYLDNGEIISGKFDPLGSGIVNVIDKDTMNPIEKGSYYALQKWDPKVFSILKKIGE